MDSTPDRPCIHVAFFNVNHSPAVASAALDFLSDKVDVLCVQEPYYGVIKSTAVSGRSALGPHERIDDNNRLLGTQHHPRWTLISPQFAARVVIYVNRSRWPRASARLAPDIKHPDVMRAAVSLQPDVATVHILNVYNDTDNSAVTYLLSVPDSLAGVDICGGDFNTHALLWNSLLLPSQLSPVARVQDVVDLSASLGHVLLSPPDTFTHFPHNLALRRSVIDLVFGPPGEGVSVAVHGNWRFGSDHAPLVASLPSLCPVGQHAPTISPRNEELNAQFIEDIYTDISFIPSTPATSIDDLERRVNRLMSAFSWAWLGNAVIPDICDRSNRWWNASCSDAMRAWRELDVRSGKRELDVARATLCHVVRDYARPDDTVSSLLLGEPHWLSISTLARRVVADALSTYPDGDAPVQDPNVQVGILDMYAVSLRARAATATRELHAARARFRTAVKHAKRSFFDDRITHVSDTQQRVWDLMSWTRPRPLPATATVVHQGRPVASDEELFEALHATFHSAVNRPVDPSILLDPAVPHPVPRAFQPFSRRELLDQLKSAPNSAPGGDHIRWMHLRALARMPSYKDDNGTATHDATDILLEIFNACLRLGHWPSAFKTAVSVVIPKPNKPDYSAVKAYRPIVLLSCVSKLGERMLAERLHFDCNALQLLHPNQMGGCKQRSTIDAAVALTHHIHAGWKNRLVTGCLAFDVAQFFPSMQHDLLVQILARYGFDPAYQRFFRSYLADRSTRFVWGSRTSEHTYAAPGVGAGQGSALSPVLTNIYISPALHVVCPIASDSPPRAPLTFYVDDGLIVGTAATTLDVHNRLRDTYHLCSTQLTRLGLVIEDVKTEYSHFPPPRPRVRSPDHPRLVWWNEFQAAAPLVVDNRAITPSDVWRYLGVFFDPGLTFVPHIKRYAQSAMNTVRAMLCLGNSERGLSPRQKRRLYISCVLPVMTYGCQVWFHSRTKERMKPLRLAHNAAARWITGAFRTSPTGALQAFGGLMPIGDHVLKLCKRYFARIPTLPQSHPIAALYLSVRNDVPIDGVPILPRFPVRLTGPAASLPTALAAADVNSVTEHFDLYADVCRPGHRLTDRADFEQRVTFHLDAPTKDSDQLDAWVATSLKPRISAALSDASAATCFTDGSVDRAHLQSAAGVHVYRHGRITHRHILPQGDCHSYDAEMVALGFAFAIATCERVRTIHVFGDNKSALQTIFDTTVHGQQSVSVRTCEIVARWLDSHPDNQVEVHWTPSHTGILQNELIDADVKEAAAHDDTDSRSHLSLRASAKAEALDSWRRAAHIQNPPTHSHPTAESCPTDCPRRAFIRRRDAYWGRSWPDSPELRRVVHTGNIPLSYFDGNSLCARAIRFLTGHAPTGEYRARFHPHMPTHCDCWVGGTQDRLHIVDQCSWFDLTSPYRTPFRLFTESLDPFPLIATWLRTFDGAFTFAFAHSPECDPLCVTCSPATWSYHDERYDYESQFEMVREPRHFPHIGA